MIAAFLFLLTQAPAGEGRPLALHPENPHYFLFRGKPTVLITSGEHYGAVLNRDFDMVRYLDTLQARGFNLTRTFTGAYCEAPGAFTIARNTLAPAAEGPLPPGRFIAPWARSAEAGYVGGGNKFDLTRWDEEYFRRLKEFVREAGRRGVVVELVLFCPYYEESMWALSPLNARNNINGIGRVDRKEVLTLKHRRLVETQEQMVRKIVAELREFDNLYYEVCNEPYFGGVTMEWQDHIIATIVDAEKAFPAKHLIAQNISNGAAKIERPNPAVSVFNFHYAFPPNTVAMNYGLNKAIGDDETGFKGTGDAHYRREGWEFILAGGAVYSNLDYSYTVGHEDGTFAFPPTQPGGGGKTLQRQLGFLKTFIHRFDFLRMKPDRSVIRGGIPRDGSAQALVEPGRQYALYLWGGAQANLALEVPKGRYRVEWLNPRTGEIDKTEDVRHESGSVTLSSPRYTEDIALRIVAK
jgi:hypothetical protein